MARKVIGGKTNNSVDYVFKKPKRKQKQLFGATSSSNVSKGDKDYLECATYLKEMSEHGKSSVPVNLNKICSFFITHYKFKYGHDCIDYNIMNAQQTFKKVKDVYELNDFELLNLIYKSFEKFEQVKRDYKLTDETVTISLFKRAFIVEALITGKKQIAGFF